MNQNKKKIFIVLIIVIIAGILYNVYRLRGGPADGFRCGSQKIPDSTLRNYYIYSFETVKGDGGERIEKPFYAILWKSRPAAAASSSSWNVVKMINDGKISIPQDKKAIYSLQPDFALSILPLTEVEINSAFELFKISSNRKPFYDSRIWQAQIAPNLMIVELPQE